MLPNWASFKNVKWLLATLLIPATLAFLNKQFQDGQTTRAIISQQAQAERQDQEARLRLYTELLSKREEADTSLRKGVFDKVIGTYLKEARTFDQKLVSIELLSLNFNESLDLSPLFWQLLREIQQGAPKAERTVLLERLKRVSNDVKDRQIALLEAFGSRKDMSLDLTARFTQLMDSELTFVDPDVTDASKQKQTRRFAIFPMEDDRTQRRLLVSVEHSTTGAQKQENDFWVDEYDFPLTNFTRVSTIERFAVVMRRYDPPNVDLTLIYFPSSRSGIKDKPFIDEVLSGLRRGGVPQAERFGLQGGQVGFSAALRE